MAAALRFMYVTVCVLVLAMTSGLAAEPTADDAVPATQPAGLGRYYGFGPMEILKLDWGLSRPVVADINGDGRNDMIVVNNRKSRIDLLLQKADFTGGQDAPAEGIDGDINDIFGREINWRFKRVSFDLDVQAIDFVVADLNGDDKLDLAYTAKDGLRISLQDDPAEASAESTGPAVPEWAPATKLDSTGVMAAGDLNGNGRSDLVLLSSQVANVLIQQADGSLAQPVKYHNAGEKVRRVWISDLNGDGRKDLVIQADDDTFPILVRYQGVDGKLGPLVRYKTPKPRVTELMTIDEAGRGGVLTVAGRSGRVQLSALARDSRQTDYPVLTYPLPASKSAGKRDIIVADVDGDGLDDVVASDPSRAEFLLCRADAKTGLGPAKAFPGLADMRTLVGGDLDGTGRHAIVALSVDEKIIAISRWDQGRLSYPESIAVTGEPLAIDLADINNDGKVDLLYVARNESDKKYHLRSVLSVGRGEAETGPELLLESMEDRPKRIVAADVDDDGRTDVMILQPYGPMMLVRQNDTFEFVEETRKDIHSGLVAKIDPASLAVAPLGPEGTTALLVTKDNFARSVIFDPTTGWKVVDQYQAVRDDSTLTTAAAVKLPGSDKPAVVTYDLSNRELGFLLRQEDGTYRGDRQLKIGYVKVRKILTGNFGRDIEQSVLICGAEKLVLVPIDERKGLLRKLTSFESSIKNAWFGAAAAGDLNGDGVPEVALCDQGRHHMEILAFGSDGQFKPATRFKVFESPQVGQEQSYGASGKRKAGEPRAVRIGDVTGDGKDDLILVVHDRIIVYPQN